MRYRQLGKWGMKVSEIALGAWVTYGDTVHDKEVIGEDRQDRLRRRSQLLRQRRHLRDG